MRRPSCRRSAASIRPIAPGPGRPGWSSSSTSAAARCLPRRLGRAPRQPVRPRRADDRDRPVRPARRPGHDRRALPIRQDRLLGRGQRLQPRRQDLDQTDAADVPKRPADPPSRACFVAEPDRDLLLDRATQGDDPERLRDAARLARHLMDFGQHYRSLAQPFDGRSPAPSSTPSSTRSHVTNPHHSRSLPEHRITCGHVH